MTFLTTIIDCNGSPRAVTTIKMEGESDADFAQRHADDVAAAQAECDEQGE